MGFGFRVQGSGFRVCTLLCFSLTMLRLSFCVEVSSLPVDLGVRVKRYEI